MKQKFTTLLFSALIFNFYGQPIVATFDDLSLPLNSYYKDTNNTPFQTSQASFMYEWTKGAYSFWSGGFSFTNAYDSTNGNFGNLYGVKAYKGYNNSDKYVVGQDKGKIRLKNPQTIVDGFYFTNTTYAYKSIRNGDSFSRKFGDTTGTGSGTTIAQGSYPDFFKVTVRGYKNGSLLNDSVVFFLADYRFVNNTSDYIVSDWRYVNTSSLGVVDSIQFFMYSTVSDQYGMLTPGFFAIDNFTTSNLNGVGIMSHTRNSTSVYPNPFSSKINVIVDVEDSQIIISDYFGNEIFGAALHAGNNPLFLPELKVGIYFARITSSLGTETIKIVCNTTN